ncbi:MAG: DUF4256 domain-containing protein [Clostridia bacterium]|nr:DUF4256 domain-containing protein [Bacillota bacterium]MBO2521757.1 DUF4256 domain-containing protein [Bacillota bacterium]
MDPRVFEELLATLKRRFEENMQRHPGIPWQDVEARLKARPEKVQSLYAMERTGGEPDVIGYDEAAGAFVFCDCAPQSPAGRRSLCYDREAREGRKKHPPAGSAVEMAESMGVELLDEEQYRHLQTLGEFDTKTSSWIKTPEEVRKLGGALFCDRRYGRVFVYHNGADSYYSSRGFRGLLKV